MLPSTRIHINLLELQPTLSLPEIPAGPKEQHDREGEIGFEESGGVVELRCTGRSDRNVELCRQSDDDEDDAHPGACNAEYVLEGNLIDGVALMFPCLSESDVCLRIEMLIVIQIAAAGYLHSRLSPM